MMYWLITCVVVTLRCLVTNAHVTGTQFNMGSGLNSPSTLFGSPQYNIDTRYMYPSSSTSAQSWSIPGKSLSSTMNGMLGNSIRGVIGNQISTLKDMFGQRGSRFDQQRIPGSAIFSGSGGVYPQMSPVNGLPRFSWPGPLTSNINTQFPTMANTNMWNNVAGGSPGTGRVSHARAALDGWGPYRNLRYIGAPRIPGPLNWMTMGHNRMYPNFQATPTGMTSMYPRRAPLVNRRRYV